MTDDKKMPDEALFQLNTGWGTLEQTTGTGTRYLKADTLVERLGDAVGALNEMQDHIDEAYNQSESPIIVERRIEDIELLQRRALAAIDSIIKEVGE